MSAIVNFNLECCFIFIFPLSCIYKDITHILTLFLLTQKKIIAYYRILNDGPDLRHMESKVAPTSVSAAPHMGNIQTRTRFLETWLFSIADSG